MERPQSTILAAPIAISYMSDNVTTTLPVVSSVYQSTRNENAKILALQCAADAR